MRNQATKLPRGNALHEVDFEALSRKPACQRSVVSVNGFGYVSMVHRPGNRTHYIVG